MVGEDGKNLSVVIVASANVYDEWMTFASWYSFNKYAPEAKIAIAITRPEEKVHQLMNWAFRLKINYCYYSGKNKLEAIKEAISREYISYPVLCVESHVCLTDKLNVDEGIYVKDGDDTIDDSFIASTKDKNASALVSIMNGLGRFNTETWLRRNKSCPFQKSFRFYHDNITVNEKRVLDLWRQATSLYKSVF